MEYQTQLLLVMISYLGLLIVWGIYQGRKVKTNVDYAIAGRSLPGWVAALSFPLSFFQQMMSIEGRHIVHFQYPEHPLILPIL